MRTDCTSIGGSILYTYEYDFLDTLTKSNKLHLAKTFNNTTRYIDDIISLNNKHFGAHINGIYSPELELKETREFPHCAPYLDLLADIKDRLTFKLCDKRDDFNIPIVNSPHLDSNFAVKPAYGVYGSQLICYTWACSDYKYVNCLYRN